jgi:hypothetical protein
VPASDTEEEYTEKASEEESNEIAELRAVPLEKVDE